MRKTAFCTLLAATALFAGCSSDNGTDVQQTEQKERTINLKVAGVDEMEVGMTETTRASATIQNTRFDANQLIDIYIKEHPTDGSAIQTNYLQPIVYMTNDATGNMLPYGYSYPYYPKNENSHIDIKAVYPSGAGRATADIFTVKEDQRSEQQYRDCDLMTCDTTDIEPTDARVKLIFRHKLSKIMVLLIGDEQAQGAIDVSGSTVKLMNVVRSIGFNHSTLQLSTLQNDVTRSLYLSSDASKLSAAIIPPQTVGVTGYFMEIQLKDGDRFYYTLGSEMTFESGKSYKFIITVKETALNVQCEVQDWVDDPDFNTVTEKLTLDS